HNLAILVLEVESRKVLGYVGNSPTERSHAKDVDIITKNRSTGSILKPMLFASLLDEGLVLPNSFVADVPTVINGYHPQNFDRKHRGAVPVSLALSRSLNVPAVRLLRGYGLQKFHNRLRKMNLSSVDRPASHYGLSLILGERRVPFGKSLPAMREWPPPSTILYPLRVPTGTMNIRIPVISRKGRRNLGRSNSMPL